MNKWTNKGKRRHRAVSGARRGAPFELQTTEAWDRMLKMVSEGGQSERYWMYLCEEGHNMLAPHRMEDLPPVCNSTSSGYCGAPLVHAVEHISGVEMLATFLMSINIGEPCVGRRIFGQTQEAGGWVEIRDLPVDEVMAGMIEYTKRCLGRLGFY